MNSGCALDPDFVVKVSLYGNFSISSSHAASVVFISSEQDSSYTKGNENNRPLPTMSILPQYN